MKSMSFVVQEMLQKYQEKSMILKAHLHPKGRACCFMNFVQHEIVSERGVFQNPFPPEPPCRKSSKSMQEFIRQLSDRCFLKLFCD